MNIALAIAAPDTGNAVTGSETYRLGMPHLALGSLAETWLLKELGHRHWLLLAEMAGREVPDFQDERGMPVYAAFRAASLRAVDLGRFVEHDWLVIDSELRRITRTQFVSIHTLSRNGVYAGEVELCSIFVTRKVAGRNRSIARIALDEFGPIEGGPTACYTADLAGAIGSGTWALHFGFERMASVAGPRYPINPCPAQDFNGADFLYFACFQAFIDRAEWEFTGSLMTTTARDIIYHGNIELGERVVVEQRGLVHDEDTVTHWCQILRDGDYLPLADVFTRRRFRKAAR
jgi:probable biosynthetic protein (TIGR04099 family)